MAEEGDIERERANDYFMAGSSDERSCVRCCCALHSLTSSGARARGFPQLDQQTIHLAGFWSLFRPSIFGQRLFGVWQVVRYDPRGGSVKFRPSACTVQGDQASDESLRQHQVPRLLDRRVLHAAHYDDPR